MTREGQKQFIAELVDNVKADLLKTADRIPEEWDGIELRQWIADTFALTVSHDGLKGKRMKDYKNEVLVRNL